MTSGIRLVIRDLLDRAFIVLHLGAAPVACVDRTVDDSASGDATSSEVPADMGWTEEEAVGIIRRRCELYFACEIEPGFFPEHSDIDQAGCEQDITSKIEGIRADPMQSEECAPALMDYYACANELDHCHYIWVTWAFAENHQWCALEKKRYCDADCNGCWWNP